MAVSSVNWTIPLTAGGVAGFSVDIALFPIDTVKTRLQSERGFWRSGGFKGIYRGLAPAAAGSVPTAALFFFTYESVKHQIGSDRPWTYMMAAAVGEVVACLIRVPVEIAKQRRQSSLQAYDRSSFAILQSAFKSEGIRGLYRGYGSTIIREIPFSLIQFPLWEFFKANWTDFTGLPLTPYYTAVCGAAAGGLAAGITTPLDVAKTRIMLAEQNTTKARATIGDVLRQVYKERGLRGLFAGIVPRVMWITLGGAVFFGFYDLTTQILSENQKDFR